MDPVYQGHIREAAMNMIIDYYDEHPINETQIRAALAREGKTAARLAPEDLYAHDQDHYGGIDATACGTGAVQLEVHGDWEM